MSTDEPQNDAMRDYWNELVDSVEKTIRDRRRSPRMPLDSALALQGLESTA